MTIFLVQSNLKHNGQLFKKGDLMEGDAGAFRHFVIDGTLREIEGASSFAEAEEFLAQEAEKNAETPEEKVAEPANTWQAKKDHEEEVKDQPTDVPDDAEKKAEESKESENIKRVITEEDLENNPELVKLGVQVGDEIELPATEEELENPVVEEDKSPEDTGEDL